MNAIVVEYKDTSTQEIEGHAVETTLVRHHHDMSCDKHEDPECVWQDRNGTSFTVNTFVTEISLNLDPLVEEQLKQKIRVRNFLN